MKIFVRLAIASALIIGAAAGGNSTAAQTANTGVVLGTITDPGGAVIPDATVDLINSATNETKTITTNSSGQYTFPNVAPGTYALKCTKQGFATMTIGNIKVDVTKSYTYDLKLEIRSSQEIVEVSALTQDELKTADAVVGN